MLATAAIWFALLRGGDAGEGGGVVSEPIGVSPEVAEIVARMPAVDQVDQLLLLGFEGTQPDASTIDQLRAEQLGGVIIGAENWTGRDAGAALIGDLRAAGLAGERVSPLIVAAQEGGSYRSFDDLPPADGQIDVGDAGSIEAAEAWAQQASAGLGSIGVDLNLFPVADVATLDSPVADRAFSDDASVVTAMTTAAVRGCRAGRIACAPLHFPGLGAASGDVARGPATVSLDAASLAQRDLLPFLGAFGERAPAVVLSLALYSAYDPVTPAALSPEVATELLRDELAFEGLAITDDLGAGAVGAGYSVPDAAVAAVAAGSDLLQIASPDDQEGVRDALLAAVESGTIAPERLAEASGRVLELKRTLGLLPE